MDTEIEKLKLKTSEDKLKSIVMNQLTQQCAELCQSEDNKIPELEGDVGILHKTHNIYQSTSAGTLLDKINLSRLCKQEEDHELDEVRYKHGHLLPLMTSWTSTNSDRRYWSCPYMGSCDFWLWKDDYIDPRFKFVIPKLLGRIGELEESVESSANCAIYEHKIVDDKTTRITKSMEIKIDVNKIELPLDNFRMIRR
ncbi:hypothetical protein CQW23_27774 [Capsicum baccatum]|uniref:Uncharacterized protein n=1 Tax=Capsicum baccatum TaxID=33114 RepID=A0A2G2VEQ0_CAPBA|nr:hypothetical protein CQW23_27774 [Capsicum baccatum]